MALIKCKECGKDVSDMAKTCPHCGVPVEVQAQPKGKQPTTIGQKILGFIVLAVLVGLILSTCIGGEESKDQNTSDGIPKPERMSFEELQQLRAVPKDNTLGCVTKDALSQLRRAYVAHDYNAVNHLLKTGCVLLPVGQSMTMLDQGYEVSKIRVYESGDAIELFVIKDQLANK